MNKRMREIKSQINNKKTEARNLASENKIVEAKALLKEIKELEDAYEVEAALLDDTKKQVQTPKNEEKVEYNAELFTKAVANSILMQRTGKGLDLTPEQMNAISEKTGADGGFAVPEDISVKIERRLKDSTDLFNLVDSEKVYTRKGERTYEKRTEQTGLINLDEAGTIQDVGGPQLERIKFNLHDFAGMCTIPNDLLQFATSELEVINLDEAGTIQDVGGPQLERIKFNLHDFAGMCTIPNDLLQFATSELEGYIIEWLVDKVRVTRNTKILYGAGTGSDDVQGIMKSTVYTKLPLTDPKLKDFKTVKNVKIPNVFKNISSWIVNQDGFNYLDSLEDATGRPYLQPDPKNPTQYIFLGRPVIELPNEVLKTESEKIPVLFGDLKSAYKYFYDGSYQLLTTNIGAGAFETNTTKTRVITKLDGTVKDDKALLICEVTVTP